MPTPIGRADARPARRPLAAALPALVTLLLLGATPRGAAAAQAMDEVWFPNGVIHWGHTQTTAEVRRGICDMMGYLASRTPLRLMEIPDMTRQGGLDRAEELGALEIRYSDGAFNYNYSGMTYNYRKPSRGKKLMRLSSKNIKSRSGATSTVAHEIGHVLGFTHEFQRWDRGDHGVSVGAWAGRDPFNFGRPDQKNLRVLTPYDFNSQFATGYDGVTPTPQSPVGALLSVHDINAIYRVYGRPLGPVADGLVFGEDVASGDFDGDGYEDLAVAARFSAPGAATGAVYFFKGVAQAPEEDGTGTTYVPWFRQLIPFAAGEARRIVLASGDTHMISYGNASALPWGDGIDELIVGLPGAGRVEVWIVNADGRFYRPTMECGGELLALEDGHAPWGGHGVAQILTINAADVGAHPSSDFGAALATGRFLKGSGDDLAIGAPKGATVRSIVPARVAPEPIGPPDITRPGPSLAQPGVYLLPGAEAAKAVRIADPTGEIASEFGASLAVLEAFDQGHDTLVVGAPGAAIAGQAGSGKVFVYGRAIRTGWTGTVVAPELSGQYPSPGTGWPSSVTKGERLGAALAAFTTREEGVKEAEHWLAVGAPEAAVAGTRCGQVELLAVAAQSHPHRLGGLDPPSCRAGMRFGATLAVASGRCTGTLCPKERAWIAVGSPHEDERRGAVHLWDVWAGGVAGQRIADSWRGRTTGELLGQRLTALRARESGGGFVVTAKRSQQPALEPGSLAIVMRESGSAQVRLNTRGTSEWSSWSKTLTPGTDADHPPANRPQP
jgi:hypothetical protein